MNKTEMRRITFAVKSLNGTWTIATALFSTAGGELEIPLDIRHLFNSTNPIKFGGFTREGRLKYHEIKE